MTKPRALLSLSPFLLASVLALGCNKSNPPPPEPAKPAEPVKAPPPEPAKPAEAPPAAPDATPPKAEAPAAAAGKPSLMDPKSMTAEAPAKYKVKFTTSKGDFVVEVDRAWAPQGADRFYNLVKSGFYDDTRFFRVIKGFMVQFGIHGDPAVNKVWREAHINDDPVKESNKRGYITFATAGPNTRTTQVFINYKDNASLDSMGFAPFGKVLGTGMKTVDALNGEYGEGAPGGLGPNQGRIQDEGNAYLQKEFGKLDFIKSAKIVK